MVLRLPGAGAPGRIGPGVRAGDRQGAGPGERAAVPWRHEQHPHPGPQPSRTAPEADKPRPKPRLVFDDPLDQQSSDDTDHGWGERPPAGGSAADLARFLDEKPPHHV